MGLAKAVVEAVCNVWSHAQIPVPLHRPFVNLEDISRVEVACTRNAVGYRWIGEFETLLALKVGRNYAVMTSSGTAALHLALLALGIEAGDTVIVSPMTFAGAAAAVRYVGASPSFGAIGRNAAWGMAVDLLGFPSPERDQCVIEDAAEALGSWTADDKPCGSFGKVSVFSFNNNKIVTTGGGGAVVTDDAEIAAKVRHLATTAKRPSDVDFIHDAVGYNYRPTELGAALGYGQLARLDEILERKRGLHHEYRRVLHSIDEVRLIEPELWGSTPGEPLRAAQIDRPNYWLNAIRVPPADLLPILDGLRAAGIGARRLFMPLPLLEPYRNFPANSYQLNAAKQLYDTTILLPSGAM